MNKLETRINESEVLLLIKTAKIPAAFYIGGEYFDYTIPKTQQQDD